MSDRPTSETEKIYRLIEDLKGERDRERDLIGFYIKELHRTERERDEAREALRKAIRFVEVFEPWTREGEVEQNETLAIAKKALEAAK